MIDQTIRKVQQRKAEAARASEQGATVYSVNGLFLISGVGEVSSTVNFPVKFIERPNVNFCGELQQSSPIVTGNFPTVSVVVGDWVRQETSTRRLFVGAKLLVVTHGPATQAMWIHWSATGVAISNPYS